VTDILAASRWLETPLSSPESNIVAQYLNEGERIRLAFSAYTGMGLARRVVGVTTERFLFIKSRYASVSDKGLLWAEPLAGVALAESYERWHTNFVYTGNSYVTVRRGDGQVEILNPRSGFWGGGSSADDAIQALYAVIANRF
jgi:hypothetical protein